MAPKAIHVRLNTGGTEMRRMTGYFVLMALVVLASTCATTENTNVNVNANTTVTSSPSPANANANVHANMNASEHANMNMANHNMNAKPKSTP